MGVLDIRPVIVEESSREPGGVLVPTEEDSPTGDGSSEHQLQHSRPEQNGK